MNDEIQSNSVKLAPRGEYGQMVQDRRTAFRKHVYGLPHSIPNGRGMELVRAQFAAQFSDILCRLSPTYEVESR